MATRLEDLATGHTILGLEPDGPVTVVKVDWFGTNAVEVTYKTAAVRCSATPRTTHECSHQ